MVLWKIGLYLDLYTWLVDKASEGCTVYNCGNLTDTMNTYCKSSQSDVLSKPCTSEKIITSMKIAFNWFSINEVVNGNATR